jgi:Ser-tRNA(Ala) deacylase AlaX
VLDQTVFYPGGGGQPPDLGSLMRPSDGAAWTVIAAHKAGGEIVHDLVEWKAPTRRRLPKAMSSPPRSTGPGVTC